MICIIALIIFAVLAVFSARHRPLAREAADCVLRRVTLRKCSSNLDARLKAQITGMLMRKHKATGRFLYRYFEVFSWAFLILFVLSTAFMGIGLYNLAVYGNCNGPSQTGFCIFDPLGSSAQHEVSLCGSSNPDGALLSTPSPELFVGRPMVGSSAAKVTIVMFGCFSCENTAKQAPIIRRLIEHYSKEDFLFVYFDFPLEHHNYALETAIAARCVHEHDPSLYWRYFFTLYERQGTVTPALLEEWGSHVWYGC
jgi:hypothetical protein